MRARWGHLRHVALRMTAVADFPFDAVLLSVFASLTTVFFGLHLGGQAAIAQRVRAFDRLLHTQTLSRYGLFKISPPASVAEGEDAVAQPA